MSIVSPCHGSRPNSELHRRPGTGAPAHRNGHALHGRAAGHRVTVASESGRRSELERRSLRRGGASGDRSPHSRREESPFQQTLLGNEDMCIVYIVSLSQLSLAWTRFKPQSSYSRKACATLSHMQHHQVRTLPSVRAFGFCVVHATTRETLQGVFAGGVSQIFTACGCCGRLRYSLGSSPPANTCVLVMWNVTQFFVFRNHSSSGARRIGEIISGLCCFLCLLQAHSRSDEPARFSETICSLVCW